MKRNLLLTFMFLVSFQTQIIVSQSLSLPEIGHRYIEYFNETEINIAQKQIWDVCEGIDNFIYLAVNDGLVVYDGVRWRLYTTPGQGIIRALLYDHNSKRIYSAGVNEFGYWEADNYGHMQYVQLLKNNEFRYKSYDFWRISLLPGNGFVYFQSHEIIYKYEPEKKELTEIFPKGLFAYMHSVGNKVYVQDDNNLMLITAKDTMEEVCSVESRIINIFNDAQGALVLAIEHAGFLRLIGRDLEPVDRVSNKALSEAKIVCCKEYSNGGYLVGTTRGGLFVLDNNFHIVDGFYEDSHLKSSSVLSVSADGYGNIWAGLDAGIACIDNSSNEYYYADSDMGQIQSVFSNDVDVIVGTNKGLFQMDQETGKFAAVAESQGIVWKLLAVNNSTIVLHDQGVFSFHDGKLTHIHKGGTMNIVQLYNEKQYYIAGEYNGLSLYTLINGQLQFLNRITNYNGYTRNLYVDKNDNIWLPVSGVGFIRLTLSADKTEISEMKEFNINFDKREESNKVLCTYIDENLILYGDGKAFGVNYINDSLELNPSISELMKICGEDLQVFKQYGNKFWYKNDNDIGYVERMNGSLTKYPGIFEKVYQRRLTNDFFQIKGYIVLGFRNGMGFASSGRITTNKIKLGVVEASGIKETITYDKSLDSFRVPFKMNNIRIYLTNVGVGKMIDYRIKGLSDEWTTVKMNDCILLSSIPSGTYTVEMRNNSQQGSADVLSLNLIVSRSWYFSNIAILCYLIIIGGIAFLTRMYYHRKNRREQEKIKQREKEKREKQLGILEKENLLKEKRITELEKERLKNDVKEKDKKLANITMNSMKRNTMLSELKQEISDLSQIDNSTKLKSNISRIVRRINSLMNNDEDWKKAETYFNNIYDGLLDRLRNNYPNLSQTDLKLCVYIKLNLSTKEIAELMNISPRSIEMARYRLRKKLGLKPTESIGNALQ